jgi:hypothetical protein
VGLATIAKGNVHAGGWPCLRTTTTRLALEKKCEAEHAAIAIRDVKVGDLKVRLAQVDFGGEYLVYKGRLP